MKREKQLAVLRALASGQIQITTEGDAVRIIGPSGNSLKFDHNGAYAAISISNTGDGVRRRNVSVHLVVALSMRLKALSPGANIEDAAWEDGWQVDHIDGNRSNNLPSNLRVVHWKLNQNNKRTVQRELSEEQKKALSTLFRAFEGINRRALAQALTIAPSSLKDIR